jgi:hypothetical protein
MENEREFKIQGLSLSALALNVGAGYQKLTDAAILGYLMTSATPPRPPRSGGAADEYELRFVRRRLMRLVVRLDFETWPEEGPNAAGLKLVEELHDLYVAARGLAHEWRLVSQDELRHAPVELHHGMQAHDPLLEMPFYDKRGRLRNVPHPSLGRDWKPMQRRMFIFWNPQDPAALRDTVTLQRLAMLMEQATKGQKSRSKRRRMLVATGSASP